MGLNNSLTSDEQPECGRGAVEREDRASLSSSRQQERGSELAARAGLGPRAGRGQGHRPESDGVGAAAWRSAWGSF